MKRVKKGSQTGKKSRIKGQKKAEREKEAKRHKEEVKSEGGYYAPFIPQWKFNVPLRRGRK